MENIRAGGPPCSTARQLATDYMRNVDSSWNEEDYGCAPDSSNSPATCQIDGYQCTATASPQGSADEVSCRLDGNTVTWHANWHPSS